MLCECVALLRRRRGRRGVGGRDETLCNSCYAMLRVLLSSGSCVGERATSEREVLHARYRSVRERGSWGEEQEGEVKERWDVGWEGKNGVFVELRV